MRRREASYFLHEEAVFLMEYQFLELQKRCGFQSRYKVSGFIWRSGKRVYILLVVVAKDYLMAKVGVTGIGAGKFDLEFFTKANDSDSE